MSKRLIIYGNGKLAQYVGYVFDNDTNYDVVAYCIEEKLLKESTFDSKPLVKFENLNDTYPPKSYHLFIAVGNNIIRKRLYNHSKKIGYSLAKFISSKTVYWKDLIYGENTFIDEGCKVHPYVEIGNNCFIMFSTIGHHTKIGDHNLISVSTLGGNVRVRNESYLGMNSVIKQNVVIADKNIIGMGCVIENSTPENSVFSNKGTAKRDISYDKVSHRFLK